MGSGHKSIVVEVHSVASIISFFFVIFWQGEKHSAKTLIITGSCDYKALNILIFQEREVFFGLSCEFFVEGDAFVVSPRRNDEAVGVAVFVVSGIIAPFVGDDAFVHELIYLVNYQRQQLSQRNANNSARRI